MIDRGKDAKAENQTIFEQLMAHKRDIGQAFGSDLDWYSQEDCA